MGYLPNKLQYAFALGFPDLVAQPSPRMDRQKLRPRVAKELVYSYIIVLHTGPSRQKLPVSWKPFAKLS